MNLATKDVDIVHFDQSALERTAVALFGRGTPGAERAGFYLEPVPQGLPPIPQWYCRRCEDVPGSWLVLRPKQPDPHDLAVTKLRRFHAGDREDLQILCDSGHVHADRLRESLASAFAFAEKEDPDHERAAANLERVIDYLEGRMRSL